MLPIDVGRGYASRVNFDHSEIWRIWRARLQRHWPWLLAVSAGLILLAAFLREPIADAFWPEARAEALRKQAEAALAAGRLSAADGSGARELFEAGIAIDPDRAELRTGLARVALAAVMQAERALSEGRFADAHRHLGLARTLSAPRARFDPVVERLREREAAVAGIDAWLVNAERARTEGRLDGAINAALPLYRRILDLQPQHLRALEGREDALGALLQQAHAAMRRGDLADGAAKIAAAAQYDRGHVDLADAQTALAESVERLRRRVEADLRAGRLMRAADGAQQWRATGLETQAVEDTLKRIAAAHTQRARRDVADFRFNEARHELDMAQALIGDTDELRELRRDFERKARIDISTKTPAPTQLRRALALLQEAEAAEARGDWLTPPGDSAYDKLRAARALAPNDPAVKRAAQRLLPRVRECFDRELRDNRLQGARVCLDARAVLEGDSRALSQARRALALRWLAVGDERIGRGELDGAQAALEAARALDPKTPGLAEFGVRMKTARASTQAP
jgi:hypothetical protein